MTRVLYLPHTSSPERLTTDHCYGWATTFFRRWLDLDKHLSVYWIVPKGAPKNQRAAWYKFTDEELKNNIKLLEVETNITQVLEQSTYPTELIRWFHANEGKYYFDIMFCEKPSILGWFFHNCVIYAFRREHLLCLLNMHYAINSDDNISVADEFETTFYANTAMADGYLFCNAPYTNIDSQNSTLIRLKKQFASSFVEKVRNKPNWIKINSDIDELRGVYDSWDRRKGEGFRVHFGYSISNLFNFKKLVTVLRSFKIINKDLKFVITTPSGSLGRGGKKPESWMELYLECARPQFFKIALRSHCFVCWPSAFTSGLNHGGVMEMTRLGVLPILYRKSLPWPWSDEWKDYSLQFDDEEGLLALLKYVRKNYDTTTIQDLIKSNIKLIDDAEKIYGPSAVIEDILRLHESCPKYPYNAFGYFLNSFPDRITFNQVIDYIKENSDTKVDLNKTTWVTWFKTGTKLDLRNYMINHGWEDVGNVDEVIFQRIKK